MSNEDDEQQPSDLTYVNVRAPATERYGVLCLRVSDFTHHKNEIVNRILPKRDRIVITAWGHPDFEIHQAELDEWTRAESPASGLVRHHEFGAGAERWTAPVSWFLDRHKEYLVDVLPEISRLVVTRYGWPDFVVTQASWESTTKIRYPQTVELAGPPSNGDGSDDG